MTRTCAAHSTCVKNKSHATAPQRRKRPCFWCQRRSQRWRRCQQVKCTATPRLATRGLSRLCHRHATACPPARTTSALASLLETAPPPAPPVACTSPVTHVVALRQRRRARHRLPVVGDELLPRGGSDLGVRLLGQSHLEAHVQPPLGTRAGTHAAAHAARGQSHLEALAQPPASPPPALHRSTGAARHPRDAPPHYAQGDSACPA